MPLTCSESVGLGISVLNIWHKHVNASTLTQLDVVMKEYVDDRIIAYLLKESDGNTGIRIVNLNDFKNNKFLSKQAASIYET